MPRSRAPTTMGTVDPALALIAQIATLGARSASLREMREGVLDALAPSVRWDAAFLHALSPRVPLETGAYRGMDVEAIRATLPEWDRYAVLFGRFRDVAMAQGGVATDRDALPVRGPRRALFERAFGGGKRVRAAVLVHLVVRDRIVAILALLRRADDPFDASDLALLRAIAPALSIADALQQRMDAGARAPVPVRLVCSDQRLTARQRELVEHVALGHTNAAIGAALSLSPNTVRNQLATIFAKLGAANRADVVRLAVLRTE